MSSRAARVLTKCRQQRCVGLHNALSTSSEEGQDRQFYGRCDTGKFENALFRPSKSTGFLGSAVVTIDSSARDANDHIGYKNTTGDLRYVPKETTRAGK